MNSSDKVWSLFSSWSMSYSFFKKIQLCVWKNIKNYVTQISGAQNAVCRNVCTTDWSWTCQGMYFVSQASQLHFLKCNEIF